MRDNNSTAGYNTRRGLILLLVIALHIAGFYVFIAATDFISIPASLKLLQVKFVHEDPPKYDVPPPSVALNYPDALVIHAIQPEIRIQAPTVLRPVQDIEQKTPEVTPPVTTDAPTGLIVPPLRISKAHKSENYPGKSVKNRESGRTELKVCVAISGAVESAEVTKSSGYPRLDEAATEMAMDTLFKPASLLGKAVPYCRITGIRFSLR